MLRDVNLRTEVKRTNDNLKAVCDSIREELDSHLDTINQNTDEIQQNYEFLAQVEGKIDKLAERLDKIEMMLSGPKGKVNIQLTHREQEVFLVLYSSPEKTTKNAIARRLGFTDAMVGGYIDNIVAKGVPVLKQIVDGETYFFLDFRFREMQAKDKVVPVEDSIVQEIFRQ